MSIFDVAVSLLPRCGVLALHEHHELLFDDDADEPLYELSAIDAVYKNDVFERLLNTIAGYSYRAGYERRKKGSA
ncbi:MAG: hypothetical protein HY566_02975 [Candidatus Kerfeldbacteria bacterium]|nr:hypothetical protein [Candidatus Kerfeldbacteria bacterium]